MAGQWLLHTCLIDQVEIELDDDDNAEARTITSLGSASLAPTGTRAPSRSGCGFASHFDAEYVDDDHAYCAQHDLIWVCALCRRGRATASQRDIVPE